MGSDEIQKSADQTSLVWNRIRKEFRLTFYGALSVTFLCSTVLCGSCGLGCHSEIGPQELNAFPRDSDQFIGRQHRVQKVVVLVFDQMRPDYIDRFRLPNFQRARSIGINFTDAVVGYVPSITIISHPVIATGLPPRLLPYQDDVWIDEQGSIGPAGSVHALGQVPSKTLLNLLSPAKPTLASVIKQYRGGKVFTVGSKRYAAYSFGTVDSDAIVTLKKADPHCQPDGENVPEYIVANPKFSPPCPSQAVSKINANIGPFRQVQSGQYLPGSDPKRPGGDLWVSGVAVELTRREPWSGFLLTFPGIDKVGHMTGDMDGILPHPFTPTLTFEQALRTADKALGEILSELDKQDLFKSTLLLITSDHGAQANNYYLGTGAASSSRTVEVAANSSSSDSPFWISRLSMFGELRAASFDTGIRLWTKGTPSSQLLNAVAEVSGVIEVYQLEEKAKDKFSYRRTSQRLAHLSEQQRQWAAERHPDFLAALASRGAPSIVALLEDGVGFGQLGDHGGAQEKVQRIPFIVIEPKRERGSCSEPVSLVDVFPRVKTALTRGEPQGSSQP